MDKVIIREINILYIMSPYFKIEQQLNCLVVLNLWSNGFILNV